MCGIIGYTGSDQAQPILLQGLARLEYRGYDSAGIAIMKQNIIHLTKCAGRLTNLEKKLSQTPLSGFCGIGHTRWATHGEPSDLNAHPHTDSTGDIVIVHNGIIENHALLRRDLEHRGCVFRSQTDTEVIAHLLAGLYKNDMIHAIRRMQSMLKGSYALCILHSQQPGVIYCTRKDSPLMIGLTNRGQFVASDIPALLPHTRDIELLQDTEIAVLSPESVQIFDARGALRALNPLHVTWDIQSAEKGGYDHFMIKEIHEEPAALRQTFDVFVNRESLIFKESAVSVSPQQARGIRSMTIAACGTAYHAAMIGKHFIEHMARLPVHVEIASEFRYKEPLLSAGDLFLAISQSGETADTLAALREAKRLGAAVMALTNVLGSTLSREAEPHVMYTHAGPEIAVASTKAYITQVEVLFLLALDLARKRGVIIETQVTQWLTELAVLPDSVQQIICHLQDRIKNFASRIQSTGHVFFIGRGLDYALAQEASLKLKEVSYIVCEAYAAGELKHGTIALVEPGTLICALVTQPSLADKTLSNIREAKSRGAKILIICPESLEEKCKPDADELWYVPTVSDLLMPLVSVIPVQLLAYFSALYRGCDPDKPRNLAKSVTVE